MEGLESQPETVTRHRRWPLQFGLRTLLTIVAVTSLILASGRLWYLAERAELARQVKVEYGMRVNGAEVTWETPKWFQSLSTFCNLPLQRATEVKVRTYDVKDVKAVVDQLRELPSVHHLEIEDGVLTDELLQQLRKLKQLEVLVLRFDVGDDDWVLSHSVPTKPMTSNSGNAPPRQYKDVLFENQQRKDKIRQALPDVDVEWDYPSVFQD